MKPDSSNIPHSLQWNRLALDAVKFSNTPLPIAARALAMMHTAMFNAWSVYDNARSTGTGDFIKINSNRSQGNTHKQKAFSYAAYRVLKEIFKPKLPAAKQDIFRDRMHDLNYDTDDTVLDISQPQGVGNLTAKLILESRTGDGSNATGSLSYPPWTDYTGYGHNKECKRDFLVPHWGLVASFSLEHNAQFRPPPPFRKSQPQYHEQVKEILLTSAKLTDEQKTVAEYWNESEINSLIVHWCEIAHFAANSNGYADNDCVRLFFALTNAMFDATIACWDCLRYYDAPRPVDIVRESYKGKEVEAWAGPNRNAQTISGEAWQPYIDPPLIPGYVSPQSTVSRAAAIILQRYTGSDQFRGFTVVERGDSRIEKGLTPNRDIQLEWPTYSEAAREAGMSGIFGGIFFSEAVEEGQRLGKAVGECAWKKSLYYFND